MKQAHISYMESGAKGVSWPKLKRIAKVLDVRVGTLLGIDEHDEPDGLAEDETSGGEK